MDIYDDRIYFVAAKEVEPDNRENDTGSLIFVADLDGDMLTDFIPYDDYNKHAGLTVVRK